MPLIVNGIFTNYEKIGEKDKPPLLILHGWGRDFTEWRPIAQRLSERHSVLLLDLPGFGLTPKAEADFDTHDYANFVKEFLRKLKVEKCTILGHSFGGRIAIVLATTTNLVEKLILIDSAGLREKENLATKIKRTTVKIISEILPSLFANRVKNLLGSEDYKSSGNLRKTFVKIVNQDLTALLPKIKVPTLIVWGSEDSVLNVQQTKVFRKLIPNAKVRIVWGAGHDVHLEKRESFQEIVCEEIDKM